MLIHLSWCIKNNQDSRLQENISKIIFFKKKKKKEPLKVSTEEGPLQMNLQLWIINPTRR